MWARLFSKISQENFIYYSPRISPDDYKIIPGIDGNIFLPPTKRYKGDTRTIAQVVEKVVKEAINEFTTKGKK